MNETQTRAVTSFLGTWADLLASLPDDYDCHLTCVEADTAVGLLQAFGFDGTAAELLQAHAEHDDEGDQHRPVTA